MATKSAQFQKTKSLLFFSGASYLAPVGDGLTLGCGVQPRCGWWTAHTTAALRRVKRRGSICYDPGNCRDNTRRAPGRPGPAGWYIKTRTNGCTRGGGRVRDDGWVARAARVTLVVSPLARVLSALLPHKSSFRNSRGSTMERLGRA